MKISCTFKEKIMTVNISSVKWASNFFYKLLNVFENIRKKMCSKQDLHSALVS